MKRTFFFAAMIYFPISTTRWCFFLIVFLVSFEWIFFPTFPSSYPPPPRPQTLRLARTFSPIVICISIDSAVEFSIESIRFLLLFVFFRHRNGVRVSISHRSALLRNSSGGGGGAVGGEPLAVPSECHSRSYSIQLPIDSDSIPIGAALLVSGPVVEHFLVLGSCPLTTVLSPNLNLDFI